MQPVDAVVRKISAEADRPNERPVGETGQEDIACRIASALGDVRRGHRGGQKAAGRQRDAQRLDDDRQLGQPKPWPL